jgi:hypothetical protein
VNRYTFANQMINMLYKNIEGLESYKEKSVLHRKFESLS